MREHKGHCSAARQLRSGGPTFFQLLASDLIRYLELQRVAYDAGNTTTEAVGLRCGSRGIAASLLVSPPHSASRVASRVGAGAYTNSAEASHWFCRSCARLRYASEGGYLRPGKYLRAYGSLP